MIVPVFKTGGRRVTPLPVGSTPTRFRQFSISRNACDQLRDRIGLTLYFAAGLLAKRRTEFISESPAQGTHHKTSSLRIVMWTIGYQSCIVPSSWRLMGKYARL